MAGLNLVMVVYVAFLNARWLDVDGTNACPGSSVVMLCQTDTQSGKRVYLTTTDIQLSERTTIQCTCCISNTKGSMKNISITAMSNYTGSITITVNEQSLNVSANITKTFSYSKRMELKTSINASDLKQCFKIEGDGDNTINVTCRNGSIDTRSTSATFTSTSTAVPSTKHTTAGKSSRKPVVTSTKPSTTGNETESRRRTTVTTIKPRNSPTSELSVTSTRTSTDENKTKMSASVSGIISGSTAGGLAVVVIIVIITVAVCRRRWHAKYKGSGNSSLHTNKSGYEMNTTDKDPDYDMSVNVAYISVDACKRSEPDTDVIESPRSDPYAALYSVVKKHSKPNQQPVANNDVADDEYNHLHTDEPKTENVYDAAGSVVSKSSDGHETDLDHVDDEQRCNATENVHNTMDLHGNNTVSLHNYNDEPTEIKRADNDNYATIDLHV